MQGTLTRLIGVLSILVAASALAAQTPVLTYPYTQGFESPPPYAEAVLTSVGSATVPTNSAGVGNAPTTQLNTESGGGGINVVPSTGGLLPHTGNGLLEMAGDCNTFIDIHLDLSAATPTTTVELDFWWADVGSWDNGIYNGVFLSRDGGATWDLILFVFTPGSVGTNTWFNELIDIGAMMSAASLTYTNNMVIRFQMEDSLNTEICALDDITITGSPPPDMTMEFNSVPVTDGGTINIGDARTQVGDLFTFTIGNLGPGDLYLLGTPPVSIALGTNMSDANVQTQPGLLTIPPTQTTTFVLRIEPSTPGPFNLMVDIVTNDPLQNPFDFTIQGNGILPNDAAEANATAGSSLVGPTGGPFTLSVDPGATLANATIELTDVDLDDIVVSAITPLTTVPMGIPTPALPAQAHPILLTWAGTVDATNPPGDYTWEIDFADTVNLTPLVARVTITINDLPPTHAILDAMSGDGSSGNPYTVNYFPGATGALAVDLATVADPNTAQGLTLTAAVQVSGPSGGTGFQFTMTAGVLSIAPAGTLVQADAGNQAFTLVVEDGTHSVLIRVDAFVFGSSGSMYFLNSPNLAFATIGVPYGPETLMVDGGTSPYTFNEISGAWPAGITLNTSTGEISGTPTELGTFSVEIRVVDANNDTLTHMFTLTVRQEVGDAGGGTTSNTDNSGCSSSTGSTSLLLLALLAGLAGLRFARSRSA